jgi:hypothetical protein
MIFFLNNVTHVKITYKRWLPWIIFSRKLYLMHNNRIHEYYDMRTTKKTPLTTFMKGDEWRLFLSFLFKSDKFSDFSFGELFRPVSQRVQMNFLYLTTMYVYCVYPAMSKKSENLSDLNKKDRNKRHSSPFCNQYICCTNMLYE